MRLEKKTQVFSIVCRSGTKFLDFCLSLFFVKQHKVTLRRGRVLFLVLSSLATCDHFFFFYKIDADEVIF